MRIYNVLMQQMNLGRLYDNREKYLDLSQKIANRNFSHVLIQGTDVVPMATNLKAYELLKPKLDDFSTDYRRYEP